ncbi:MAG: hypothetical protein QF675_11175, partial [SAR324 cluster bacterium]|nr:hypothetical protein [SAR324 cluster bacterium]
RDPHAPSWGTSPPPRSSDDPPRRNPLERARRHPHPNSLVLNATTLHSAILIHFSNSGFFNNRGLIRER